jgi:hypothetical protein
MTQTKVEAPFVENSRPFRNLIINGDMIFLKEEHLKVV